MFGVCSAESIVRDDVTPEAGVSPPEHVRKQLVPEPHFTATHTWGVILWLRTKKRMI